MINICLSRAASENSILEISRDSPRNGAVVEKGSVGN